ncbi:class I SAM-dependent methyltransferase [Natranaerobius thermophilus]|uniref:Methyltransferase type 11 n=1 Tax=Natranaerobius thermophilus (strain ATCC BAA-1301 / DSM 18059 / JW/NM-WN-LF) TaxID=457570 RepID=B2A8H2_NATTJ|nr:class I SAM-dependent methyltransferase [Natranaerobius thermophilus]ACB85856.1 Methyltransferase type 11 [Natranaerobius thermophilus JW/NM-WN-LF]
MDINKKSNNNESTNNENDVNTDEKQENTNERQETKAFFDTASQYWDDRIVHNEDIIRDSLSYIDFESKNRVLDVGTGTGIMLKFLLPNLSETASILAVDLSPQMIAKAKGKYRDQRIKFQELDVETEPFQNEQFDLIILYSVFPHLNDKSRVLRHLSKSLITGGELCILHSKSRAEINDMHKSLGNPVSNHLLPPISELQKMAEKNRLTTQVAQSDENSYFYLGKK